MAHPPLLLAEYFCDTDVCKSEAYRVAPLKRIQLIVHLANAEINFSL